jgi:hypothetical protein
MQNISVLAELLTHAVDKELHATAAGNAAAAAMKYESGVPPITPRNAMINRTAAAAHSELRNGGRR